MHIEGTWNFVCSRAWREKQTSSPRVLKPVEKATGSIFATEMSSAAKLTHLYLRKKPVNETIHSPLCWNPEYFHWCYLTFLTGHLKPTFPTPWGRVEKECTFVAHPGKPSKESFGASSACFSECWPMFQERKLEKQRVWDVMSTAEKRAWVGPS